MIYHWEHIEPRELLTKVGFTVCGEGHGPGYQIIIGSDAKGYPTKRIHAIPTPSYINIHFDEGGGRFGHRGRGQHPAVHQIARTMRRIEAERQRSKLSTWQRLRAWEKQFVYDIIATIRDEVRRKLRNTIKSIKRTVTWKTHK